jgi:hypothetical protein
MIREAIDILFLVSATASALLAFGLCVLLVSL